MSFTYSRSLLSASFLSLVFSPSVSFPFSLYFFPSPVFSTSSLCFLSSVTFSSPHFISSLVYLISFSHFFSCLYKRILISFFLIFHHKHHLSNHLYFFLQFSSCCSLFFFYILFFSFKSALLPLPLLSCLCFAPLLSLLSASCRYASFHLSYTTNPLHFLLNHSLISLLLQSLFSPASTSLSFFFLSSPFFCLPSSFFSFFPHLFSLFVCLVHFTRLFTSSFSCSCQYFSPLRSTFLSHPPASVLFSPFLSSE